MERAILSQNQGFLWGRLSIYITILTNIPVLFMTKDVNKTYCYFGPKLIIDRPISSCNTQFQRDFDYPTLIFSIA